MTPLRYAFDYTYPCCQSHTTCSISLCLHVRCSGFLHMSEVHALHLTFKVAQCMPTSWLHVRHAINNPEAPRKCHMPEGRDGPTPRAFTIWCIKVTLSPSKRAAPAATDTVFSDFKP